ncbi:MAG: biotin--[acetyl-CoA-carboxylase] ligase, partial [Floccifex sp.]
MSTKQQILFLLENNRGTFFSGEQIAKELNVSRNAIWKAIKSLQKEGYNIQAISNKGYSLSIETDIVSKEGIEKYIKVPCDIHYQKEVTSTNTLVVQKAIKNEKEGYVLVSSYQTHGKGRTGHSFYSPSQSGVYLSVLLRPVDKTPMEATNITSMAAVAACKAIEDIEDVHPQIKWINDIFVNNKKVCGILTEASISMESKCMDYVVMGIGFNVYVPENGFPKELQDIAGSIFSHSIEDGKNKLVGYF